MNNTNDNDVVPDIIVAMPSSRVAKVKILRILTFLIVVLAILGLAAPTRAVATQNKQCGTTTGRAIEGDYNKIHRFEVEARGISCRRARRIVHRYLRFGKKVSGWTCMRTHGEGGCWRGKNRRKLAYGTISGPAIAHTARNCGDIAPLVYDVTPRRVSCKRARRVANRYQRSGCANSAAHLQRGVACLVGGFTCRYRVAFEGAEYGHVRCVDGRRSIRFNAGA